MLPLGAIKEITALPSECRRLFLFLFYLRRLLNNATIVTINIVNAKSASYVTIAATKVRMISHRHHSFQVNLKGAKKCLFLPSKSERSNRHRYSVPPGLALRQVLFYYTVLSRIVKLVG